MIKYNNFYLICIFILFFIVSIGFEINILLIVVFIFIFKEYENVIIWIFSVFNCGSNIDGIFIYVSLKDIIFLVIV